MSFVFTTHACKRAKQRSISFSLIDLAVSYGSIYFVGDGCVAYLIDKSSIKIAEHECICMEKLLGVAVIVSGKNIVTVQHTRKIPNHWKRWR